MILVNILNQFGLGEAISAMLSLSVLSVLHIELQRNDFNIKRARKTLALFVLV